jgi:hypothetical protein
MWGGGGAYPGHPIIKVLVGGRASNGVKADIGTMVVGGGGEGRL